MNEPPLKYLEAYLTKEKIMIGHVNYLFVLLFVVFSYKYNVTFNNF